jgi:hypothetical protein
MEPINTRTISTGIQKPSLKSSSTEPSVKAINNTSVRPEFVSPKGVIDAESGVYVVQFRNASTGNVNFQYPNKKVVAEYTRSDNLISAPETKSQGSSSSAVVSSVDTASVESNTSTTVGSSGQTNISSGSVSVSPLGNIDNV